MDNELRESYRKLTSLQEDVSRLAAMRGAPRLALRGVGAELSDASDLLHAVLPPLGVIAAKVDPPRATDEQEDLRSLAHRIDALRHDALLLHPGVRPGPLGDAVSSTRGFLLGASHVLHAALDGNPVTATVTQQLEAAIATRPPEGGWHEGAVPYPETVSDVAGEIAAFIVRLDESGTASGLLDEVIRELALTVVSRRQAKARAALQPLLDEMTATHLVPSLREAGIENPEQYRLDYDLAPLRLRPADPFGDPS